MIIKRMNLKFLILLLIFPVLNTQSQEILTLSDAIDRGLRNNFQIKIAKANTQIAVNNNSWGQTGMLPSLNYNLLQNNSLNFVDNPASFLRGEFMLNNLRNNIDLGWTIFNGFRALISKERLDKLVDFSLGNQAVIIENTIQAIILAYQNALLEKEKLSVMKQVLSLSRDRYNLLLERQKLGTAVTFDVLLVKNSMLTDSVSFMMQEATYKNAMRNLNLVMAENISQRFVLNDSLKPELNVYDAEILRQKVISNNSTLRNQYINQQILKNEVNLLKADLTPRVNMNAGMNYSDNWLRFGEMRAAGHARDYYMNFSVSFNLFNGGRTRTAIENAKIQEKIIQLGTNEMELTMTNQLYQLLDMYMIRTQIVSLSAENLRSAEINMNLAQERFKSGIVTSFEYREIQLNYLNAAVAHLSSVYDQIETHTELLRLTGGIISE
jgi:outer membrane protein